MALLTMNFYAHSLSINTGVSIILPESKKDGRPLQSLYLTHGGGGDHTYYHRYYPIERWVEGYNLAVIMPSTPSRYKLMDMEPGEKWLTYAGVELPAILGNMLNLSKNRGDTFAMGGSGGGYNSIKLAMHFPERFGAIVGFCPALLSKRFVEQKDALREQGDEDSGKRGDELRHIFGWPIPPEDDAFLMLEAAAKKEVKSKLFIGCGTEDKLWEMNRDFCERAVELGFDATWDERPGGHTYEYGEEMLKLGFKWLPLEKL